MSAILRHFSFFRRWVSCGIGAPLVEQKGRRKYFPRMHKALDSIPSTMGEKRKNCSWDFQSKGNNHRKMRI
jgi:hypothetical protein